MYVSSCLSDPKRGHIDYPMMMIAVEYLPRGKRWAVDSTDTFSRMINPDLYKKSKTYDFFMKSFGFSRSIERFLAGLQLENASVASVLDAGCGTGILGLHFLDRFPDSKLTATDLEPNFLQATLANAEQRRIDRGRLTVGISDVSTPQAFTTLEGQERVIPVESFGIVCIGAVIGYAKDTEASLRTLLSLLVPGGYLINVEMNESPTGRFVSHRYQYHNIALDRMAEIIAGEDCDVTMMKFGLAHLPAKLTRVGVIARKR